MEKLPSDPRFAWVDDWFEVLHEQGERMEIPFGRIGDGAAEPEWVFLPHWRFDGVGGLGHLLRRDGYDIPRLPSMRKPRKPKWGTLIRALIHVLRHELRARKTPWISYDPLALGPFEGAAWTRFTEDDTKRILASARKDPGSLNSFLLWHLNQVIQPLLKPTGEASYWMVPVNMRGAVTRSRDTANHSSYLGIPIPSGAPATRIQTLILGGLRRELHWAGWWSMMIGKWIGKKGMRRSMDAYREKGHSWVGIFSNAGQWPPKSEASPEARSDSAWIGVVTVTRGHPIGGGCIMWRNQLHLTLVMHPCLGLNLEKMRAYMSSWRESILGTLN